MKVVVCSTTFLIKRDNTAVLRRKERIMSNEIEVTAHELALPVIEELGYELVETRYTKTNGENNLTFYIYKKGGIMIDDCEKVSKAIDQIMDDNDVSHGEFYYLNVSSLGLDRPVVTEDDYRRSLDTDLELIFVDGAEKKKKKTHGILVSYDDENVVIDEKGRQVSYKKENLATVRPYLNFK